MDAMCEHCGRHPVDRDGVCFGCRMRSIGMGSMQKLQAEREGGYTQRMLIKETIDAAEKDGREIQLTNSRWI